MTPFTYLSDIAFVGSSLAWPETPVSITPVLAEVLVDIPGDARPLFLMVAGLGGLIAVLGIAVAVLGLRLKEAAGATVEGQLPGGVAIQLRQISQGVVIAIVGAVILISSLYLYRETRTITTIETRTENPDGTETLVVETAD
jgi:formate hydrogenlyase subunit 3/multisubunit Na+/H+ antiporter MnhD subunit